MPKTRLPHCLAHAQCPENDSKSYSETKKVHFHSAPPGPLGPPKSLFTPESLITAKTELPCWPALESGGEKPQKDVDPRSPQSCQPGWALP